MKGTYFYYNWGDDDPEKTKKREEIIDNKDLSKKEENQKYCLHEFKEYVGFNEKYFYCTKCDKKL